MHFALLGCNNKFLLENINKFKFSERMPIAQIRRHYVGGADYNQIFGGPDYERANRIAL